MTFDPQLILLPIKTSGYSGSMALTHFEFFSNFPNRQTAFTKLYHLARNLRIDFYISSATKIFSMSDRIKVIWINARWIPAKMIQFFSFRHRPFVPFINENVSQLNLSTSGNPDLPISQLVFIEKPNPASGLWVNAVSVGLSDSTRVVAPQESCAFPSFFSATAGAEHGYLR